MGYDTIIVSFEQLSFILFLQGNKYLLELDPAWKSLLQHYEDNGCLVNEDWPWP